MRYHRNGRIYAAAFKPGASNQPSYAGSGAFAPCCPIDDSGGLFMPAL